MNPHAAYAEVQALSPDALVEKHAPLVKRIARHLSGRLPPNVDVDDLNQAGLIALLDAARNYNAAKGANFETYAGIRIRGAMLDEVRRQDWVPRSLHRRHREIGAAVQAVENRHGREARPEEVAAELGVSADDYHRMTAEIAGGRLFSFDELQENGDGSFEEAVSRDPGPERLLEDDAFKAALADTIGELPEREALVMALYYDEGLNLREAGEVMGVSESRVCQLHGQALSRLRIKMEDWVADARGARHA